MAEVAYEEHPAMFKNNPLGFILALILVPLAIGILILLFWYLKCKATLLRIEGDEILHEEGLMSKRRTEIAVDEIRTVTINQSFFNRIFGVGTIEIYTSGDHPEIVVHGMPDPNAVRQYVKDRRD